MARIKEKPTLVFKMTIIKEKSTLVFDPCV